jgi:peptidoglycan/LPS O-acetylase OafA/YrhL
LKTAADPSRAHLAVLDGLRGLAIVLVVATHSFLTGYRPALSLGPLAIGFEPLVLAGSLGVELFFFISGFVLFLPYARAMRGEGPQPTLAHFIDRRFIKIVPSYYVALFAAAFLFFVPPEVEARRSLELLRHATFTYAFWNESMYSFVSAFWSLGVEVQFYVLFPAIAALMRRRPVSTYVALLVIGEGYRLWLQATGRNQLFYYVCLLPAQIDLFGLGMLSAYAFVRFRHRLREPNVERSATALAVAALGFGTWLLIDFSHVTKTMPPPDHQSWQSDHRLIVAITIAALTLGSLFALPAWRALVANPLLLWLSTISYNLYLWHEAVLVQCEHTGFPCSGIPNPWQVDRHWDVTYFVTYVGISLLFAVVMTYGFERPLLRLGSRGAYEAYVKRPIVRLLRRERR